VSCSVAFLLGTFFRSATMYHPQRRAILHLKSQRRKILESNILKAEKSNSVFDLKAIKNGAMHFAFGAAFLAAFAFHAPIVYLVFNKLKAKFILIFLYRLIFLTTLPYNN
jgi:hypothetical protein